MNIIRRIFISLGTLIFAVCCGAFLLFGISGTGWKALAIPTGSMRPDMPPGSLALMHSVPASSLKIGDIITYANPIKRNSTISHRIVRIYKTAGSIPVYVTKGDANKGTDRPITISSVKGKVVWHVQDVGYLLLLARNPFVILPIVYIAGLLIMIEEVKRLSDYYKLSQPYKLIGYKRYGLIKNVHKWTPKLALGIFSFILSLFVIGYTGPQVYASLKSNTVVLANNRLVIKGKPATKNQCSESSTNNISVTNNNSQSSSTGNATVSGNTNGGSASSGNSNNSNTTTTSITITNC